MSDSLSCDVGSAEERVVAVVDEFMSRVGRGERPDVEEYVRRHPELADVLRQVLPAVQMIRQDGASGPQAPGADAPLVGGTLGDFRIVREVGRGGMGVVYEAEQVSLRRRVALKVLPLAGMLDPRQRQRFRNEAQAAASLHHTNIVPVYFVGEERGVHFYAMQFIDGRPLSDLVCQLRQAEQDKRPGGPLPEEAPASQERTVAFQPPPGADVPGGATVRAAADDTPLTSEGRRGREYYRRVAELGVQAAEALDHAHQLGIVHRDVKPANLLLDGGGRLWVADFGLARMQQGEGGLTLTGDLVGTLRYMSPEQALAKRVVIDHRTDIYSLGATLYELLMLRPAFAGADRQELLRQIAFEEPVAPRRLERAVPAELETIVLKALEKNPADRYTTAKELADDLRRWLDDKPIRARRPSLRQIAGRWVRRHRAAAWAAGVVLAVLLLAAGLFGGIWVSWAQRRLETERLAQQRQRVAEAEATSMLKNAISYLNEDRLRDARRLGLYAAKTVAPFEANPALKRQLQQFELELRLVAELRGGFFGPRARLLGSQTMLYTDVDVDIKRVCALFARVFRHYGLDPDQLDARTAGGHIRAMRVQRQVVEALDLWAVHGRRAEAQGWSWAAAAARAADPDEWRDRLRDAWGRRDKKAVDGLLASAPTEESSALILAILLSRREGGTSRERALALLRKKQEQYPSDFWANYELAFHLHHSRPPRLEEAIRFYTAAVVLEKHERAHMDLGDALAERGDLDGAIAQYRVVVESVPGGANPTSRPQGVDRRNLVCPEAYIKLGNALVAKGRFREGVEVLRRGHEGGSRKPNWRYPSEQSLRKAERLADLDARLPVFLNANEQPKDTAERLDLIQICRLHKRLYAAAARLSGEAFAAQPALSENLASGHRYNAACAAALAGCGQGRDAAGLDAQERARLRKQALDWLHADLGAWRKLLENEPARVHLGVAETMKHWLKNDDFAGVRGEVALASLPEAERSAWRKLWAEVGDTLARAHGKPGTVEKPRKDP